MAHCENNAKRREIYYIGILLLWAYPIIISRTHATPHAPMYREEG